MKKILALLIVLTLVLSVFTGCELPDFIGDKIPTDDTTNDDQTPPADDDKPPVNNEAATLEDAVVVLRDLYKGKDITSGDFDVVSAVMVDDARFTITWTTDSADVVIAESQKEGFVTVDVVPAEPEADIPYTLTAVITDADGKTIVTAFNFMVPKYKLTTYAQYLEAKDGDPLVVEGVIYGIMSKSAGGDKENSVFVQDVVNGGGYYVYGMADDPAELGLQIGQTVRVKGVKAIYNGTPEIKDATIEVRNADITTVTPTDLTEIFTNAATAGASTLLKHLGEYVTISGVTILEAGDNGYYYFELDGIKTYLRISSSSNCTTAAQETTIKNNHSDKFYYTATVTGTAAIYQGNFYIMPVDGNAFSNFGADQQPLPDSVKAGMVKDSLTLPAEFVTTNGYTLPSAGKDAFTDVAISWALAEGTTNATITDSVFAAVLPESGTVEVKLIATITKGEAVLTKEITVKVTKLTTTTSIVDANAAASGAGTEKYMVTGVVDEIVNTTYGNIYIKDAEGNRLYIYGIYDEVGNVRFDKLAKKPVVGDTITVYGILSVYNGTSQMKNVWLLNFTHEHSYTNGVCGCGETDPNYVPACTNHTDANGDFKCDSDGCAELVLPEDGSTLTIAQALAIGALTTTTQKYYVTGMITSVYNTQYGNMYITDGTDTIIVYGLYYNGSRYDAMTVKPVAFDTITVYGILTSYNGVGQFKNADLTNHVPHAECTEFTEATCKKLAACVVCGKETGELAAHTMVEGVCSVCGHIEGAAAVVTDKATLTYTTNSTTNMTGNNDAATLGLDGSIFSVIGNKGGTNNNCGLNKAGQIRLYGSSSNGNGSYFTVTSAEGYTIQSIKITFTNTTNNKNCQLTINGASTVFDGSSTTWEVDVNSNSFKLQNVIKGATTQIYIASIEITYVVPSAQ